MRCAQPYEGQQPTGRCIFFDFLRDELGSSAAADEERCCNALRPSRRPTHTP